MKKRILFYFIVCACFFIAISKKNLSNSGKILLGNIEALSQSESPDQGKRDIDITEETCVYSGENGTNGKGILILCKSGDDICYRGCFKVN